MRLLDHLEADGCHLIRGQVLPRDCFTTLLGAVRPDVLDQLQRSLAYADLGQGILLPHARVEGLAEPIVRVALLPEGLEGLDGWHCCFLFLSPLSQPDVHLQLLTHLAWLVRQTGLIGDLKSAGSAAALFERIRLHESNAQGGFISLDRAAIFRELGTSAAGLLPEEAENRLAIAGPNLLETGRAEAPWKMFGRNLVSIFALLLWAAGGLCFIPGVDMPQLGWAIFAVVLVNAAFSFWQEHKAGRAVQALQKLLPRETTVIRGGAATRLPATGLVWGDIIQLEEGDLVPADARIIESAALQVNNATLTGESRPVYKIAEPLPGESGQWFLWTELPNMVFAGTTVQSGSGRAVVTGTAMGTEIGKIARLTQEMKPELSPLQREMKSLVNILTAVSIGIGVLFFFLGTLVAGLAPVAAFIFTIGITVANIPEGLLPTLSLSLAMGVQRLARRGVLVKHLAAVETLGSTTVICTDKTGTLTTNRISVMRLWDCTADRDAAAPLGFAGDDPFMLTAVLCNNARLLPGGGPLGDPTEGALLLLARNQDIDGEALRQGWPRLAHHPFDSVRKRMSTIHHGPGGQILTLAKGAPLELLACCDRLRDSRGIRPITGADRESISAVVDRYAAAGLRTLGFASGSPAGGDPSAAREEIETGLCFLGITGMEDPPRPEVAQAVASCRRAGIRLVMITGDYGLTAAAIARQVGMTSESQPGTCLSGQDLDRLEDPALDSLLRPESGPLIFARMDPSQKLRITTRLKAAGQVVAVTGDGVNDAAALKKADIGIAMGQDASDVAREAAAMVVLNGDFSLIVAAIEEGRAVYANIRRFVTYILTSNVPELVPFILFVLLKLPLVLTIMQILAVDLGTDLVPALGLGVEAPEPGLMDRPPRRPRDHLINLALWLRAYAWLGLLEAGLSLLAFILGCWNHGWTPGSPLPTEGPLYALGTTMTLAGIVACQVGNVFACRTQWQSVFKVGLARNRLVLGGIAAEIGLILILVYVPFFQGIFGLHPLETRDWLILAAFPVVILAAEEGRKLFMRRLRPAVGS